jgi:hypothetical protein
MKPLPPAQLTDEDYVIWWIVTRMFWCQPGVGYLVHLEERARNCDRRDADMMYGAMKAYGLVGLRPKERNFLLARWGQDSWKL